ncbi:DUF4340 domain-containing protein [Ekhidna sp.]|uniref:DUF4340 domain-containing protein n=1 Tax=Ekhidna sp. TaxID=2608089 RepID=UPI003CCBAF38
MSKSAKYIIAVAFLLGLNLALFFSDDSSDSPKSTKYFQVEDLDAVSKFLFIVNGDTTKIERSQGEWMLNNTYKADAGFVNSLISVLERVEAGRTIENWDNPTLGKVYVTFGDDSEYTFQIATNPTQTKTYFVNNGEAREVAVPGYRDNVADIFTLHPDQWRERMVFDGSWRTIQRLKVENNDGTRFEIQFDDTFFLVNGNPPSDSTAVVNYLNQFQQFQANEMISKGRFPVLDSISETEPIASVQIEDIKNEQPFVMSIYANVKNQPYHLVIDASGRRMVIDSRRVQQILQNPSALN